MKLTLVYKYLQKSNCIHSAFVFRHKSPIHQCTAPSLAQSSFLSSVFPLPYPTPLWRPIYQSPSPSAPSTSPPPLQPTPSPNKSLNSHTQKGKPRKKVQHYKT